MLKFIFPKFPQQFRNVDERSLTSSVMCRRRGKYVESQRSSISSDSSNTINVRSWETHKMFVLRILLTWMRWENISSSSNSSFFVELEELGMILGSGMGETNRFDWEPAAKKFLLGKFSFDAQAVLVAKSRSITTRWTFDFQMFRRNHDLNMSCTILCIDEWWRRSGRHPKIECNSISIELKAIEKGSPHRESEKSVSRNGEFELLI